MNSILKFFDNNPLLNLISFFIGVFGFILAIIFYIKSIKEKKPIYDLKTFRLIDDSLSGIKNLSLTYRNLEVKNLSLTKIAFWNNGKESINISDIAKADSLKIFSKEGIIIYDYEIVFSHRANNLKINNDEKNVLLIIFDFLNYHDGFVLNIYHNGKMNSDVEINGTFIDSQKFEKRRQREYFLEKYSKIFDPLDSLFQNENFFIRLTAIIIGFPILFCLYLPLIFILGPIDFLYYRLFNNIPDEFDFHK